MAEKTGIEWTDSTFNPWWGCTKISPACDHCYAADLDKRTGGDHWGNVPRRRTSAQNWNEPRRWQKAAPAFQEAHGRRRRVFCASMADVFDNQVDSAWRDDLWALIRECPDLDWLLLTKRPQNIARMLPAYWDEIKGSVWLGTTVEDQLRADLNIPHLLKHDCAVRFLSCEPMVGAIDLTAIDDGVAHREVPREEWGPLDNDDSPPSLWWDALSGERTIMHGGSGGDWSRRDRSIDWVIAGGESGPQARVADPVWFRSLRDQCLDAGVPFLFKQWGNWNQDMEHVRNKKDAGRLLDGVTHDGYPEVRHGR